MNFKKSVNVALAMKGIKKVDFAKDYLDVSENRLYVLLNSKRVEWGTLNKFAKALDMKVSEFIALGED